MDKRDSRDLDEIRLQVDELLGFSGAGRELSESQREDLIAKVYTVVHTRHLGVGDTISSNRRELSALVELAELKLGDIKAPFGKFELISKTSELGIVRCSDGIEIAIPIADLVFEEPGRVTVNTSALAAPMDSRWLQWSPPGRFAEKPNARVYVNARAADAISVWCDLVRELERMSMLFITKIGASTEMLRRADCIVLYCAASDVHRVVRCMDDLGVAARLESDVPGFSAAVAKGIGVALDQEQLDVPVVGSVGYHWSRALVNEWVDSGTEGLEAVYTRLAESWAVSRHGIESAHAAELCSI